MHTLRKGKSYAWRSHYSNALRRHIVWGKVAELVGGRGAAIVVDAKQMPHKCHCFHATPRCPCVHGVPAGDESGQAGLCAYKH